MAHWGLSRQKHQYITTPLIWTLVIRIANYPDVLGLSDKFVDNSTKLEMAGYRIKYNTMLWFLELKIRHGRKVQKQVHTVNSKSRTSNCQFSKKIKIFRIFCIYGWLAVPIIPDMWSST